MVSSKRSTLSLGFQRTLSYIAAVVVGFYLQLPFYPFLTTNLHYREPSSPFFGAFQGLGTGLLALTLAYTFWFSIVSNYFGKKGDYIFLGTYYIFAIWMFSESGNTVPQMYVGLMGTAAVGSALGYMLKIGKQNWFPKK